jgi:cytochrome oxidase Cu insertion factor (SCO1/SenC/PrrC family)
MEKRLFAALALALLSTPILRAGALENVAPQRGRFAAPITWMDDTGRVRKLSEFSGYPLILLPIYTRCQAACIQNVAQLKKALTDSKGDPQEFRVFLFCFDSTDTPSVLAEYRQRESVPLGWLIGTADQSSIDALLESTGFQYGKAGTEFMHPNMLVFLDAKLRVAKWIYGTSYSGRDIDAALKVASGQSDWIGRHSDMLYALLLFAASLFLIALVHLLLERKRVGVSRLIDSALTPTNL